MVVLPVIGCAVVRKACNTLKRKLRHFAKQPSGVADFRDFVLMNKIGR
jgi:hypothetical protein